MFGCLLRHLRKLHKVGQTHCRKWSATFTLCCINFYQVLWRNS